VPTLDEFVEFACHAAHAATDHVFTQFYPVLRDRGPR